MSSVASDCKCRICRETKHDEEIFSISNCNHSFCKQCIATYVSIKIRDGDAVQQYGVIRCPAPRCETEMDRRSCRSFLPQQMYDQWKYDHCKYMSRESKNGVTGDDPEQDTMFVQLANSRNWRKCPNCKFYVEKIGGCLHITCRCGKEFCYGCGSYYDMDHACPRLDLQN